MLGADDHLIIVGSGITPHDDVRKSLEPLTCQTRYMEPDDVQSRAWAVNEHLELNHHHRRNLALLEALRTGADLIVTIDDDNFPRQLGKSGFISLARDWFTDVASTHARIVRTGSGWYQTGGLCVPPVQHRGIPQYLRTTTGPGHASVERRREPHQLDRIGVYEALWWGDPDIDAIERITMNPYVQYVKESVILDYGTWSPFNSQATVVHRELAPLMMMWTNVGRYDDIWCSYLMRAYMDHHRWLFACGNRPGVTQKRNEHDLIRDLEKEMLGMRHTPWLTEQLREFGDEELDGDITPVDAWEVFADWIQWQSTREDWIPSALPRAIEAWGTDLQTLQSDGHI
jgi:hypothetical protein